MFKLLQLAECRFTVPSLLIDLDALSAQSQDAFASSPAVHRGTRDTDVLAREQNQHIRAALIAWCTAQQLKLTDSRATRSP